MLVEINCETDFVAKNENFREFVKDITLHIAAANPTCVSREQVNAAEIEREKAIYRQQVEGKPANIVDKIVEGKVAVPPRPAPRPLFSRRPAVVWRRSSRGPRYSLRPSSTFSLSR